MRKESNSTSTAPPEFGETVLDTSMGRLAEFRGTKGELWHLRAMFGVEEGADTEWDTIPAKVIRTEQNYFPAEGSAGNRPRTPSAECHECEEWRSAQFISAGEGELSEAVDCLVMLRRHHRVFHPDEPLPPVE